VKTQEMRKTIFLFFIFISGFLQCTSAGAENPYSKKRIKRVAGGSVAKQEDLPWMVLIVTRDNSRKIERCSGTLINDQ